MYEESCLKSELDPVSNNRKMLIDGLDVVTSYKDNQQHLKLAVSICDPAGYPVFESGVELVIDSPDGTKFSLVGETDPYGIAYFELENITRGRWEVIVFKVDHPDYKYETSKDCKPWSVKYI
jgi:hypothetical protein